MKIFNQLKVVSGITLSALIAFSVSGCTGSAPRSSGISVMPSVSQMSLSNNKLTLTGTKLNSVTKIKIKGQSLSVDLHLEKVTATSVVATVASSLQLAVGAAYNLIITNAAGDTSVPFTYDLSGVPSLGIDGLLTFKAGGTGGIVFPDGTTQTTAAGASGGGGAAPLMVYDANGGVIGRYITSFNFALVVLNAKGYYFQLDAGTGGMYQSNFMSAAYEASDCTGNPMFALNSSNMMIFPVPGKWVLRVGGAFYMLDGSLTTVPTSYSAPMMSCGPAAPNSQYMVSVPNNSLVSGVTDGITYATPLSVH